MKCMWATRPAGCRAPVLRFKDGRTDGAVSANGRVQGAYAHGLFADRAQRDALLG